MEPETGADIDREMPLYGDHDAARKIHPETCVSVLVKEKSGGNQSERHYGDVFSIGETAVASQTDIIIIVVNVEFKNRPDQQKVYREEIHHRVKGELIGPALVAFVFAAEEINSSADLETSCSGEELSCVIGGELREVILMKYCIMRTSRV